MIVATAGLASTSLLNDADVEGAGENPCNVDKIFRKNPRAGGGVRGVEEDPPSEIE